MADLLSAVTSNGAGSTVDATGPGTIQLDADAVLDGARIDIEMCEVDTAGKFQWTGLVINERNRQAMNHNGRGAHKLRAVVRDGGASMNITKLRYLPAS